MWYQTMQTKNIINGTHTFSKSSLSFNKYMIIYSPVVQSIIYNKRKKFTYTT